MKPGQISGLKPLVNDFDLFLIDQYGVLHNGIEPYPGAIDTLERLKSKNKRVVVISNSGKRAGVNVNRLATLGFDNSLFDNVITSGEVAFQRLVTPLRDSTTKSCYLISRDNDVSAIDGLDLRLVKDASKAELIIIGGSEPERHSEDAYRDILHQAAKRSIPCICTNPDKKMLTGTGLRFGAGRIAEIYEELGGTVEWIGKPHSAIYHHILDLHSDCSTDRVLSIGDSIEHDIVGGKNINAKTLLVLTGINAGVTADEIQDQFRKFSATPDYISPELAW